MNLIEQLLAEMGADTSSAFTVAGNVAYFKGVRGVQSLSADNIALVCGKNKITVTGKNLTVGEYFQGDMVIKGDLNGVQIEKS